MIGHIVTSFIEGEIRYRYVFVVELSPGYQAPEPEQYVIAVGLDYRTHTSLRP